MFRDRMVLRQATAQGLAHIADTAARNASGGFLHSCVNHVGGDQAAAWAGYAIGGVVMRDAVAAWHAAVAASTLHPHSRASASTGSTSPVLDVTWSKTAMAGMALPAGRRVCDIEPLRHVSRLRLLHVLVLELAIRRRLSGLRALLDRRDA